MRVVADGSASNVFIIEERAHDSEPKIDTCDPFSSKMVGLGRVELPTRSLGNCCSIHLSYSPSMGLMAIG